MHVAARMTREEYLALPEPPRGVRFELLDGELVTMNDPLAIHQIVAGRIYAALLAWSDSRSDGGRVLLPVDTDVGPDTIFGPDVQWFAAGRPLPSPRERPWPVGDLVVEVASPSTARYDALVKAGRYADAGAREVWLVDPAGPTVRALRSAGQAPVVFGAGAVVTSPLLPGFVLPVDGLDR
ncbi:Uma2 family endonuclease [Patulibacter sp.]|uniref:Uma2 family endonuclease n=1 Tax=Patulibacter sp. TaxID=1912859 RepID=UPI002727F448|nr:Uma2 family endonuclease [Patulibacter sp.]MDO9408130.1 Uma2 family endonuclease [Patulibacter sp.]